MQSFRGHLGSLSSTSKKYTYFLAPKQTLLNTFCSDSTSLIRNWEYKIKKYIFLLGIT